MIERAKGILMERHDIDEESAFGMLRDEARRTHRKVVDLAEAVIVGRPVLPTGPTTGVGEHPQSGTGDTSLHLSE